MNITRPLATLIHHHVSPLPLKKIPEPSLTPALLKLKNGLTFEAISFGASISKPISGEVVFTTSLVGYPESMTDPSYKSQILVFTQPLIGNYGVPGADRDSFGLLKHFESESIQAKGIIVSDYCQKYSHWNAVESLGAWCARFNVPALSGVDTRAIVTLLRENGSMMGNICASKDQESPFIQESMEKNLISQVSRKSITRYNPQGTLKVTLLDCGVKQNIIKCLVNAGAQVIVVPWDYDLAQDPAGIQPDGIFLSNGPGSPLHAQKAVLNLSKLLKKESVSQTPIPIFGICMGNQLLGLAAGYKVYKLPYGNRGHNQPVINSETGACLITSQNHGYALDDSQHPKGWKTYFKNANDGSNEGIKHLYMPWSSVQFHPEAMGGPLDSQYLIKEFVESIGNSRLKRIQTPRLSYGQLELNVLN